MVPVRVYWLLLHSIQDFRSIWKGVIAWADEMAGKRSTYSTTKKKKAGAMLIIGMNTFFPGYPTK